MLEHREPRERQPAERIARVARADDERRVEPGRGLVGDEAGHPQPARGGALRGRDDGADLIGPRGFQDARRVGEPEGRCLPGQVVEPCLDHTAVSLRRSCGT